MIRFPQETKVNRVIQQKLFKKEGIDTSGYEIILKAILKEDQGYLKSDEVKEILFIEIKLNDLVIPETLLIKIANEIPYKTVFILDYDGRENYSVVYKDFDKQRVLNYYWDAELDVNFGTKNLDNIWNSILSNFSSQLPKTADIINLENKEILEKISVLEKVLNKEKIPSRQVEINREINKLKKELNNGQN